MENGLLTNGFPKATETDWRKAVDKTLNGASFETLRTELYEGFATEPLYTKLDGPASEVDAPPAHCAILHVLSGASRSDALEHAAQAMSSGANGLMVGLADDALNWLQKREDLRDCLEQAIVRPQDQARSATPAVHEPGSQPATSWVYCNGALSDVAFFAASIPPAQSGVAGLDPITAIALSGELPISPVAALEDAAFASVYLEQHHPRLLPFMASDRVWHGAIGSAVEDLGLTLAAAVSYWRAMVSIGVPIAQAADKIAFQLTAASDIFLTIAKFRAARLLWRRVVEAACGDGSARPMHILAETSPRELTHYDPHTNILRGTAAAFGAMAGGANALTVQPYDALSGNTPRSQRLARNTVSILQLESHIRAAGDPGRGSFAIESLTEELCAKAWSLFREVESRGGLLAAMQSGFIRERLESVANARAERVAKREDKITGVSAFPNPGESIEPASPAWVRTGPDPVPSLQLPPSRSADRFAAMVNAAGKGATRSELRASAHLPTEPLSHPFAVKWRVAEPFEQLRLAADRAYYRIGVRPPVFIAVLGPHGAANSSTAWTSAFLASAGLEAVVSETGFQNAVDTVDAFRQSACPLVCLCGSEASLASIKGVAHALRKAGARGVYLTAPPSSLPMLDTLDAASLSGLLYEGCNAVAILTGMHRILRVDDLASDAIDDETRDLEYLN